MIRIKNCYILNIERELISMVEHCRKHVTVNGFGWSEDISQINFGLLKNFKEDSDIGHFLEVDVHNFIKIYPFCKI